MTTTPKYPDVTVRLSGTDSNIFGIIGSVKRAIQRVHGSGEAGRFANEAMSAESYDDAIQVCMKWVEVE